MNEFPSSNENYYNYQYIGIKSLLFTKMYRKESEYNESSSLFSRVYRKESECNESSSLYSGVYRKESEYNEDSSLYSGVYRKEPEYNEDSSLYSGVYEGKYMNENIRKKRDINNKLIKIIDIKSYNDTNYLSFFMSNNKKMRINKCNGCYPVFQENQEGHIGEYGCLGDYVDMCFEK